MSKEHGEHLGMPHHAEKLSLAPELHVIIRARRGRAAQAIWRLGKFRDYRMPSFRVLALEN